MCQCPELIRLRVADTVAPEEGHGFDYDLIVIGGGSGGLACVKEAVRKIWVSGNVAYCELGSVRQEVCRI